AAVAAELPAGAAAADGGAAAAAGVAAAAAGLVSADIGAFLRFERNGVAVDPGDRLVDLDLQGVGDLAVPRCLVPDTPGPLDRAELLDESRELVERPHCGLPHDQLGDVSDEPGVPWGSRIRDGGGPNRAVRRPRQLVPLGACSLSRCRTII